MDNNRSIDKAIICTDNDQDRLQQMLLNFRVKNWNSLDSFDSLVKSTASMTQLINKIPSSLPVIEQIYNTYRKLASKETASETFWQCLKCEQMLNKILWWLAITFQHDVGEIRVNSQIVYQSFFIEKKQKTLDHLRSILLVIRQQNPEILNDILAERGQLNECLESLGCHGLVNCPIGFIGVLDAVLLETVRHQDRLKSVMTRLKSIQKLDRASKNEQYVLKSTSALSHQRQMDLRLSQIYERLRQNNVIESILEETLQTRQLSSLLRIVQKRIKADKILIGLFNSYINNKPDEFSLSNSDPVVAKLILLFKCAYEEFSSLLLHAKSTEKPRTSTNFDEDIYAETAKNDVDTGTIDFKLFRNLNANNSLNGQCNYGHFKFTKSVLQTDLIGGGDPGAEGFLPSDPDASFSSAAILRSLGSKQRDVDRMIESFSYLGQRKDMLDGEFQGSVQMHQNLPLFTIVQTHQAVKKVFEMQYKRSLKALCICAEVTDHPDALLSFKNSTYKLVYLHSKSNYQSQNINEVFQQLQKKFDFSPSIQQKTSFKSFVEECVDIMWDLVGAVQGAEILLEYERELFDKAMHTRSNNSISTNTVIRKYLWPGLLMANDKTVLYKAVVLT